MPFGNEHSCQLNDPKKYAKIRRKKGIGGGPDVLIGITNDGKPEAQSLRFPKSRFTEAEARKKSLGAGVFEAATANAVVTMESAGAVRREKKAGKDYIVAPVVMIVEGVHKGNGGALFYSAAELKKSVSNADGIPLFVQHPRDQWGNYTSAKDSTVNGEKLVGFVSAPSFNDDGAKMPAEIWAEEEKLKAVSPESFEAILEGMPLNVSTGVYPYDADMVPGVWQGEQYLSSLSNIQWDHLALLPGKQGACSWDDGCGVRANEELLGNDEPRAWAKIESVLKENRVGILRIGEVLTPLENEDSIEDKLDGVRTAVYALDSVSWIHYVRETYKGFVVYGACPKPEAYGSKGQKSKTFKRRYSIDADGNVTLAAEVVEVEMKVTYVPVGTANEEKQEEKKMDKDKLVQALIDCAKTPFVETHRAGLMAMDVPALQALEVKEPCEADKKAEADKIANEKIEADKKAALVNEKKDDEGKPRKPKRRSIEEYLEDAPPEVVRIVNESLSREKAEKESLVEKILANQGDLDEDDLGDNDFLEKELVAMDVRTLRKIANVRSTDDDFGGRSGPVGNAREKLKAPNAPIPFPRKKAASSGGDDED